jgi:hypothetical protein
MEVLNVSLSKGLPTEVTVKLTIEELAVIGRMTGRLSPITAEEVFPKAYEATSEMYDASVGEVFNRWWDGGIDDYLRNR